MIQILGIPMPPSVNKLYSNVGRRRIISPEYRIFQYGMAKWVASKKTMIKDAIDGVKFIIATGGVLSVNREFYFPKESVITKKGLPKRNDTSNRIKALDDLLAKMLDFDDCYIWNGEESKHIVGAGDCPAFVNVYIQGMEIPLFSDSSC